MKVLVFTVTLFAGIFSIEDTETFICHQDCKVPLFTCVQNGIPGHQVMELQKCVAEAIYRGDYPDYPECEACVRANWAPPPTPMPLSTTPTPTTPVPTPACAHARKKLCNAENGCTWNEEDKENIDNQYCEAGTPSPLYEWTTLEDMKPCIIDCRDYAVECTFNMGVQKSCEHCVRVCVLYVSDNRPEEDTQSRICSKCMRDVFTVIGDPRLPPPGGFNLFDEYKKWLLRKIEPENCRRDGGKWKEKKGLGKCRVNKVKKLQCRNILLPSPYTPTPTFINNASKGSVPSTCEAVGCRANMKKGRCTGTHKWKKPKSRRRRLRNPH